MAKTNILVLTKTSEDEDERRLHQDECLLGTHDNSVISFLPSVNDTVFQISSTEKEADQKIIRHALHRIKVDCSFIEMQSIDTDVLILLLA